MPIQRVAIACLLVVTLFFGTAAPSSAKETVDINKSKVEKVKKWHKYKGKAIKPVPVVRYNGKTLKQGKDYTLRYDNNVRPGGATVTIQGKGDYQNRKVIRFGIYKNAGNGYPKTAVLNGKIWRHYRQHKGTYRKAKFFNDFKTPRGTISNSGCGPTSIAIIMSGYGYKVNPGNVGTGLIRVARTNKSAYVTSTGVFAKYLWRYGFKTKAHKNNKNSWKTASRDLKQALSQGHQVVYWVGYRPKCGGKNNKSAWKPFTNSGYHYIALLGIKGNKVYVANPNAKKEGWCGLSTVGKACGNYRGWIEIWK